MGKQINFYMDNDDERAFIEYLVTKHDAVFISNTSTLILDSPPELKNVSDFRTRCYITKKKFLPLVDFFDFELNGGAYINFYSSYAIEYTRCPRKEGVIFSGRVWGEVLYYTDIKKSTARLLEKEVEYTKMLYSIIGWIGRRYTAPSVAEGFYIGPGALKRQESEHIQLEDYLLSI